MSAAAAMAAAADFGNEGGLTVSAGGEYQVISQEYYRLTFDTISTDIIENWYLDADAINDFILKTNLDYGFRNRNNRFDLNADLEFSGDRFLGRADGAYRIGSAERNLKATGSIETKAPFEGDEDWVEGYTCIMGYLRTDHRIRDRIELRGKIGYELMLFAENDSTVDRSDTTFAVVDIYPSYDYALWTGSVGGKYLFSDFGDELGWEVKYRHRQVPDSSLADYDQLRFGLDYSHIDFSGYLSFYAGMEIKDYIRPEDEDDFIAWELNALATRQLSDRIEGALSVFLDLYRFDKSDVINRDYRYVLGELKGLYRLGAIKTGPLARLEFRRTVESDDPLADLMSDDYDQWEAGVYAEMLNAKNLYFVGELTLGRREFLSDNYLLTDYSLVSPSIMTAYSFNRYLSANLLFDATFERHRETKDNSNLYLFSIGLTARF